MKNDISKLLINKLVSVLYMEYIQLKELSLIQQEYFPTELCGIKILLWSKYYIVSQISKS